MTTRNIEFDALRCQPIICSLFALWAPLTATGVATAVEHFQWGPNLTKPTQNDQKTVNSMPGGPNPPFVPFYALRVPPTATGVATVVEHFQWGPHPD